MSQDLFANFERLLAQTSGDPAHASIELLLLQMEPSRAEHLRLCAIPHQFDLTTFQALVPALDSGQVETQFQEFSRLSLVNVQQNALALHDEARRYLFEQWLARRDSQFREASARLTKHFERSAAGQSGYALEFAERQRMFHMIGVDGAQGTAEFERLFRQERRRGRLSECEALIALIREYDAVLSNVYSGIVLYHEARLWFERRDWQRAEQLFQKVLANEALPKQYHVKALNRTGLALANERRWLQAIGTLQNAVEMANMIGDMQMLPLVLHDLGAAFCDSGDQEQAKRLLQRSIALANETHNPSCLAAGYNSLGALAQKSGDLQEAIGDYKQSLSHLSELGDAIRTAQVYNNLGAVYADLGDWSTSKCMYEKSLELKKTAGDTLGQAKTLANLVPVYQSLNSHAEAIAVAEQAISIFEEFRDVYGAAVTVRNLAKLHRRAAETYRSRETYAKAIDLFHECGDEEQAHATQKELDAYLHPVGMPWWAWVLIVVSSLLFASFILLLVYAIIGG